ncbi:MAG: MotA/TolQ/ExbB proton channel family protein [bacterium]
MIMGKTLFEIFRSSPVMLILLAASIASLALIIERLVYFTRNRFNPARSLVETRNRLRSGGVDEALRWVRTQENPLGRLFAIALENPGLTGEEVSDLLYGAILEERVRFERLLGGMGTLANAATLLGLLGTVTGLIQAFGNIAATGSGGPAVVSGGIAEALLTTAFGLIIGIPTLFCYNYFSKKAADTTMVLESTTDRFMVLLERYKRAAGVGQDSMAPSRPAPGPAPRQTGKADGWEF